MTKTRANVFAFVIMPFDQRFLDVYKFGIQFACNELKIQCERVDEQKFSDRILDRIYMQIHMADVVIAELSEMNPNVYYELGYAHALNKNVIMLTNKAEDIPFDLKHHRHIVYDSITNLKDRLIDELKWHLKQIGSEKKKRMPNLPPHGWREMLRELANLEKWISSVWVNVSDIEDGPQRSKLIDQAEEWQREAEYLRKMLGMERNA
jgi:nucleoside 2-deoxyribosyltransferase